MNRTNGSMCVVSLFTAIPLERQLSWCICLLKNASKTGTSSNTKWIDLPTVSALSQLILSSLLAPNPVETSN